VARPRPSSRWAASTGSEKAPALEPNGRDRHHDGDRVADGDIFWRTASLSGNRATNNNDFRQLFRQSAHSSVNALPTLQSTSPVKVAAR
jgi:hypothetical protein